MFKTIIQIVLFTLLVPIWSYAQFSVSGKIIDKSNNQTLPSALISLDGTMLKTVSNLEGEFKFENVKTGKYSIKVTYLGYEDFDKEISVEKDLRVDITLYPSAIMQDEVVITATRASERTGTTYSDLTKADIKKADLGKDLPYILNMTPSVVSSSDAGTGVGYTSIRIRGTDISRINVTLNGIPMNDPESQGVWWVNMPDVASSLNSVQIQRGVGTSSNGAAAFGASINMLTAGLEQNPGAEINTSYGSFNTQRYRFAANSGLIDGKWSFDTRLSKISSDGYVDRASSDLKSFFVSAAYYGKNSILRFNVFSGKEKTYQSWYGIPKDSIATNPTYNPYTYDNQTDNYQQDHYQMLYTKKVNAFWNFNGALHYTKGRGYYESKKDNKKLSKYGLPNYVIGNDTIRRTDLVQQKWLDNDFMGFTFSMNYNNKKNLQVSIGGAANHYINEHFGKIIWAEYALMGKDYEWYRNNGTKNTYTLYTKATYQINDNLGVFGDIQYRRIDYRMSGIHDDFKNLDGNYSYNFINPKAGINYSFNENNKTYFSVAVSNKEPSRNDFRDADDGKLPNAEKLTDLELGYSYNQQNFIFRSNLFLMNYKDQLVMTGKINNVGEAIMTNVDKSYRAGVELVFGARFLDWLSWNANVSLSQNKIMDFTEYADNWDTWSQDSTYLGTTDIAFSPNIIAANQFEITPIKNATILLNTKFVGKQYIDNTSNNYNSLDEYTVTDLILKYNIQTKWIKEIGLVFSINNIFNAKYVSNGWVYSYNYNDSNGDLSRGVIDGYFPQAGINFMAGLNLKF
ncbi:MAG: TonB-dependent receptor [Bacteroidetes bacterium]|nr:MAG: TonB-dependent receptor [Bacteroidota bacterium]